MNWFMIWLDFNAIVGVWLYGRFGWSGLIEFQQWLVNRLMRGVHGK